jgi:hypothetical protein
MMRRRNLRVTEQLLAELEAKRFDSGVTERILAAPSSFPRLLRACFLAQDGQLEPAKRDIEAALEHAGPTPNPVVGLVAGMLWFVTHEHERALALLDQIGQVGQVGQAASSQDSPLTRRARQTAIELESANAHELDPQRIEQAKRFLLEALARYQGPRR